MNNSILIVDSQATSARLARQALEKRGFEVRVVTDGHAALELLHRWEPGVVVIDPRLPDIDGAELARHLRDDIRTTHLPIILLTNPVDARALVELCESTIRDASRPSSQASRWSAEPLESEPLDPDSISRLVALGGPDEPAFVEELVNDYLSQAELCLRAMQASFAEGDLVTVRLTAHKLLGSTSLFGARELVAALREVETTAAGADRGRLAPALARTERAFEEVSPALRALLH